MNSPRFGSDANACTLVSTPERTRNVPAATARRRRSTAAESTRGSCRAFGHSLRMNQCGADEPRHERGVLDRIPEPPSAPAEHVIRPPAAERDAERQERPGHVRPRPRPTHPVRQRRGLLLRVGVAGRRPHRARRRRSSAAIANKGYGESDIAGVQHRRMHDQAGILQGSGSGRRRRPGWQMACERIRRQDREQQEAERNEAKHAEHTRDQRIGQAPAQGGDCDAPQVKNQDPQQQRTFMRAPDRGKR